MSKMRKSRELAMQVLFLWDAQGQADAGLAGQMIGDSAADDAMKERASKMAEGAWASREAIDQRIEKLAPQWPTRRQPGVDRAILRLATWELDSGQTPPKVVIDEAIELAKEFSTENSPSFINGVLDAILHNRPAEISPPAEGAADPAGAGEGAGESESEKTSPQ
jgi:N utilization substance protein B